LETPLHNRQDFFVGDRVVGEPAILRKAVNHDPEHRDPAETRRNPQMTSRNMADGAPLTVRPRRLN
jgi:hypothetical protein